MEDLKYSSLWHMLFGIVDHMGEANWAKQETDTQCFFRNLTISQARMVRLVISLCEDEPQGISLKTIASGLNISAAAASEMVDILVKKGIFVRETSAEDRRAVCIRLSEDTTRRVREAQSFFSDRTKALTAELSETEREELFRLLSRIYEKTKHEIKHEE